MSAGQDKVTGWALATWTRDMIVMHGVGGGGRLSGAAVRVLWVLTTRAGQEAPHPKVAHVSIRRLALESNYAAELKTRVRKNRYGYTTSSNYWKCQPVTNALKLLEDLELIRQHHRGQGKLPERWLLYRPREEYLEDLRRRLDSYAPKDGAKPVELVPHDGGGQLVLSPSIEGDNPPDLAEVIQPDGQPVSTASNDYSLIRSVPPLARGTEATRTRVSRQRAPRSLADVLGELELDDTDAASA